MLSKNLMTMANNNVQTDGHSSKIKPSRESFVTDPLILIIYLLIKPVYKINKQGVYRQQSTAKIHIPIVYKSIRPFPE